MKTSPKQNQTPPMFLYYVNLGLVGLVHGPCFQCSQKGDLRLSTLSGLGVGPQQGDLRLSGPPSGQGAGSGARTRDRRVPADLRADSQATVLPTPPHKSRASLSVTLCKILDCNLYQLSAD
ncbi:hypothetical protein PoB_005962200 [Plakobranchus ocellatus]|uniref:Uncharacterized protein n=1 Tax=Plakobranchus ocellatus TaxID=259542 RepID=A0AAV4CMB7_9GAST|nr:hypothetical protein PoB_005962200 [Plakobranchus ocellatus]